MLIRPGTGAKLLGISYPTLRRWILSGRLAARRTAGGRYFLPDAEILRLMVSDELWLNVARAQILQRRVKASDALAKGVDLELLERIGLAERYDGYVVFKECIEQPARVLEKLFPSLLSLKYGIGFKGDAEVAEKELEGFITLDYAAYRLTSYQVPKTLYIYPLGRGTFIYPDDFRRKEIYLRSLGFSPSPVSEADVALLPPFGDINEFRVHLDSLARGGRSTLDALAIEMLKPEMVVVNARYPVEIVRKVLEDLEGMKYGSEVAEVRG